MKYLCLFMAVLTAPVVACDSQPDPGGGTVNGEAPDTVDTELPDDDPPDTGGPSDAEDAVTVSGARIALDGEDFVSRGLIMEGLLLPQADVDACLLAYPVDDDAEGNLHRYCVRHNDSRDYLYGRGAFADGNDLLTLAIQNWHANTIRFNLLQVALDPNAAPDYLEEIVAAVALARAKKLVVMLALFDSPAKDDDYFKSRYPKLALDDGVTLEAAKTLARRFGDDRGVILELLNEPYLARTAPDVRWRIWRDGGSVDYGQFAGHAFVGVNRIIQEVRSLGAKNAIIVQAPSATFDGFPGGVVDPADSVIYSAHAFLVSGDDVNRNWQLSFGEFAKTHPFIMTAWGVDSSEAWCSGLGPDAAQAYLNTLQAKGLGVVGFALDVNYSIIRDFRQTFDQPSKISRTCASGGGGELLQAHFSGQLPMLPNALPVVTTIGQPGAVLAGQAASFAVNATDGDGDPLNYRIAWGDGSASPSATTIQTEPSFAHVYANAGSYSASVDVVDARGGLVTATFTVDVE